MMKKSAFKYAYVMFAILLLLTVMPVSAFSQNADLEFDTRYQIALKIQSLQPISEVVENTVNGIALRYPEEQRREFKNKMMRLVDFTALEKDAARSMAETFTLSELKVLYAYRSSIEGRAIREKTPIYQTLVEKNLFKYLDQALMQVRTGDSNAVPQRQ